MLGSRLWHRLATVIIVSLLLSYGASYVFAGKPGERGQEGAGWWDQVGSCIKRESTWKYFIPIYGQIKAFGTLYCIGKVTAISVIVKGLWALLKDIIIDGFTKLLILFLGFLESGLTATPDWNSAAYNNLYGIVLTIITPLLFVQIIVVAGYLMFSSIDPGQRSRAKTMLTRLLMSLVLVGIAKPAYILLFDLISGPNSITSAIFDATYNIITGGPPGAGAIAAMVAIFAGVIVFAVFSGVGLTLLGWVVAYLLLVVFIVYIRYSMIVMLYIIFPFTIFLYYFEYTRSVGGDFLMKTIMWLIMGPVMALVVSVTVISLVVFLGGGDMGVAKNIATSLEDVKEGGVVDEGAITAIEGQVNLPAGSLPAGQAEPPFTQALLAKVIALFMFLGGVVALVAVPLVMSSLMHWVGGAIAASGMMGLSAGGPLAERWKQLSLVTAGELMMGRGSQSLVSAATNISYMNRDAVIDGQGMLPGLFGSAKSEASMGSKGSASRGFMGNLAAAFSDHSSPATKDFYDRSRGAVYGTPMPGGHQGVESGMSQRPPLSTGSRPQEGSYAAAGDGRGLRVNPEYLKDDAPPSSRSQGAGMLNAPVSELIGEDGKPMSTSTTSYDRREGQAMVTSSESQWGVLPAFRVMERIDSVFKGMGDVGKGVSAVFKQKGRRLEGVKLAGRGAGKILVSAVPISPFMPVRMMGRIIYTLTPVQLPPALQPYGFAIGGAMKGIGFRQVFMRAKWAEQMDVYREAYRNRVEDLGKLDDNHKTEVGKRKEGVDYSKEDEKYRQKRGKILSDMGRLEDGVVKTMDRMGFGKTPFADVLPENPDYVSYLKHLELLKKQRDRAAESNPAVAEHSLYDAYIRKSRVTEKDGLMQPASTLWEKYEKGEIKGKDKGEFEKLAKSAKELSPVVFTDNSKDKTKAAKRQAQARFMAAGLMKAMGIEDSAEQLKFLESHRDLLAFDGNGNLTRQRYVRLDGALAQGAHNREFIFQESYDNKGEALVKAESVNLPLHRDSDGNVYASPYDMKYLTSSMRHEDWARNKALASGFALKAPMRFTFNYSLKGQYVSAQGQADAVAEVAYDPKKGSVLDPEGNHATLVGQGVQTHMGDRVLFVRTGEWAGKLYTPEGREATADEANSVAEKIKAGERVEGFVVQDWLDKTKYVAPTEIRQGADGGVQFGYKIWRHYGYNTIPTADKKGRPDMSAPTLIGRDGMVSAVMGMPTHEELNGPMTREMRGKMEDILLLNGKKLDFGTLGDDALREEMRKLKAAKGKEFEKDIDKAAEGHRRSVGEEAAKLLAAAGVTGISAQQAAGVDGEFELHKEHIELAKSAGLSDAELQAIKASVQKTANDHGVRVASLSFYDSGDTASDPNPMLVRYDNGAHLQVNLAYIAKKARQNIGEYKKRGMSAQEMDQALSRDMREGLADFLKRADSHLNLHELAGHNAAEKNVEAVMKATKENYEAGGRGWAHRWLMFRMTKRNMTLASKEVIADGIVPDKTKLPDGTEKDNPSLIRLYVGDRQDGSDGLIGEIRKYKRLGRPHLINFARAAAIAKFRGLKTDKGAAVSDMFDEAMKGQNSEGKGRLTAGQLKTYQKLKEYFEEQAGHVKRESDAIYKKTAQAGKARQAKMGGVQGGQQQQTAADGPVAGDISPEKRPQAEAGKRGQTPTHEHPHDHDAPGAGGGHHHEGPASGHDAHGPDDGGDGGGDGGGGDGGD